VSETPAHVQLTSEQVEAIVRAAQEGRSESVVMLLPDPIFGRQLPPAAAWAQRIREDTEAHMSLALARGLLLLARLAEGQPALLTELASELGIPLTSTGKYLETLMAAGLVERDQATLRYRLVR
jgi:DNA-binding transcriptional ArsR family regulator